MRFDLTVNDFTLNTYIKKYLDVFLPYSSRPYIHVCDVAEVITAILNNFDAFKNNVFNIGFNSENYQKIEIARIVKERIPETKIEVIDKGSDMRDYRVDFSKLARFADLSRKFGVREGVEEIVRLLEEKIITDPHNMAYYNTTPKLGT